jgi:hypothetical protein
LDAVEGGGGDLKLAERIAFDTVRGHRISCMVS